MKKILLSLDGYSESRKILKSVLTFLAGLQGSFQIVLLKTYTVPVSAPDRVIETYDAIRSRSQKALDRELAEIRVLCSDGKFSFEAFSQMGSLPNVIVRVVRENNIDCVVMGRKGGAKPEDLAHLFSSMPCSLFLLPEAKGKL